MKIVKRILPYILILLVVVLLEVFLFNYKFFIGRFDKELVSKDISSSAEIHYGKNNTFIEIVGICKEVKTVYFDINYVADTTSEHIDFEYKDSTHLESYRSTGGFEVVNGDKNSYYISLNASGNIHSLLFSVPGKLNFEDINSIYINPSIPMNFSIIRILLISVFISLLYLLLVDKSFKKMYIVSQKRCNIGLSLTTIVAIAIIVLFSFISYDNDEVSFFGALKGDVEGNQITQELVDAFAQKRLDLDITIPEKITALDNIYDFSQRDEVDENYGRTWDHCIYNDKVYSYYGIASVLTLFLPFFLVTGLYFSSTWAVVLFSVFGIFFLSLTYKNVIKKYFPTLPSNFVISGNIVLLLGSGIFFCAIRPLFYEIAIATAFAAISTASYHLVKSNLFDNVLKTNNFHLFLMSSWLGYAVLCRATMALYCIPIVIFGLYFIFKEQKINIKSVVALFLPLILFAILQMTYNNMRFGSPFDFGIQYSITINDFTRSEFHIHFVIISLMTFLFNFPNFKFEFPYLESHVDEFNLLGYFYVDEGEYSNIFVGNFFRALPMFSYFSIPSLLKSHKKNKALLLALLSICFIVPLAIIASTWESGVAVRYYADFSFEMILGSLILFFMLYKNSKNKELFEKVLVFSVAFCVIVNFGQYFNFFTETQGLSDVVSTAMEAKLYSFANLFNWWS